MKKKICSMMLGAALIFVPAGHTEAGGFLGGVVDYFILDPEIAARKHTDLMVESLWKAAVLMEESKLCLYEAAEFDLATIAASQEAIRAMTLDPHDINAIRQSTYNEISEDELVRKSAMLLRIEDRADFEQALSLLTRSKHARSAAHHYNKAAADHIAQALLHIARIDENDKQAIARASEYLVYRVIDAEELIERQKRQSNMMHRVLDVVEKKWNIKEPSKKERKKLEKELLPL